MKRSGYELVAACAVLATCACMCGCINFSNSAPEGNVPLEELKTTATYDVIGEATGTSSGAKLFGLIPIGCDNKCGQIGSFFKANPITRAAIYNAIESVPTADTLLAPRYHIKSENYIIYCKETVTVKGKAVRYNISAQ